MCSQREREIRERERVCVCVLSIENKMIGLSGVIEPRQRTVGR